jgi:1-deoxy-D-xylulose-5-phosphate synthase
MIEWQKPFEEIEIGKGICLKKGTKIAVLAIGTILKNVQEAIEKLSNNSLFSMYDMRFVKPLDDNLLHEIFTNHEKIITIEDGVISGGFGSAILEFALENKYKNDIKILGIPDEFIEHGSVSQLQQKLYLDVESLIHYLNSI